MARLPEISFCQGQFGAEEEENARVVRRAEELPRTGDRKIHVVSERRATTEASGTLNRNIAPPPLRFSAHIRPRWLSTIVRAMESPIPIPPALLVKNGSKICSALSGGMPGP